MHAERDNSKRDEPVVPATRWNPYRERPHRELALESTATSQRHNN